MTTIFPPPCPTLPQFNSLLFRGHYHASAPIHLLLSHVAQGLDVRAMFLTPHRGSFKDALLEFNDESLDRTSGHGRTCALARRTEVYYPPTLAHLRLLLSTLHEYHGTLHHTKTTLENAPSLLVLHEISSYFSSRSSEATVSAYLSIISAALFLSNSWSPRWCVEVIPLSTVIQQTIHDPAVR
ncbi:hypothetical protein BV20DRAFT_13104 [Pilatotrama ljubarskyi]|nr:hypothetical protein BV20DRAFT_13104 [Pilatotrama ljubarskyi]